MAELRNVDVNPGVVDPGLTPPNPPQESHDAQQEGEAARLPPENQAPQKQRNPGINQPQQEELDRQKQELQQKRVDQAKARETRKRERQKRAQEVEQRREKARQIQAEVEAQRAQAKILAEGAQEVALEVSTDSSSLNESLEELPGEIEFVKHFKTPREFTPERDELIHQRHGEAQACIGDIIEELDLIEAALKDGKIPQGEQITEFFEQYHNIVNRITHLCFTQGKYADLRGLHRADLLLELDVELKVRAEEVLACYREKRDELKLHRRQRKQEQKSRMEEPPIRRERRKTDLDAFLGSLGRPNTSARPAHARSSRIASAPGALESLAGGVQDAEPAVVSSSGKISSPNMDDQFLSHSVVEPVRISSGTGLPSGVSTENHNGNSRLTNASARSVSASQGYTPHYLKPNGEGANYYLTLPKPWDETPEHEPTPLLQVPNMQRAGWFTEFDGTIDSYRHFRSSFITLCHLLDLPITTKYIILRNCLARGQVMSDLLNTTQANALGYRTIINTLEERFGHPEVLLNLHVQRMHDMPRIRETAVQDVDALLDSVRGYEAAKRAAGAANSYDPTYFNLVKNKLSDRLRREYARYCSEQGMAPGHCQVDHLTMWIKTQIANPLRAEPPSRKIEKRPEPQSRNSAARQATATPWPGSRRLGSSTGTPEPGGQRCEEVSVLYQ